MGAAAAGLEALRALEDIWDTRAPLPLQVAVLEVV